LNASQLFAQRHPIDKNIPHSLILKDEDIGDPIDEEYLKIPSTETFVSKMKALRLSKEDLIVCYDSLGIYTSARLSWALRYFGA